MTHRFCLVAIGAAVLSGPILAQEPLTPNTFEEHLYERAKVSGGLVVGAMFSPDRLERGRPVLEAVLPAAGQGADMACLRVTSRDGTYESASTFSLAGTVRTGAVTFAHPTKHSDVLRQTPTVARMNLGGCDHDEPVIPVIWADASARTASALTFYVNTAGADTVVAYETASGEVVARCAQIEESAGIKYTAACPVDADRLPRDRLVTLYFDVTRNRVVETYEVEVTLAAP